MKDRVIVTSVIGEKYEAIWKLTGPTVEAYADRIDADTLVIHENPHPTTPHWVKFALYEILHKRYKRAAWLDADIIIRGDAPDIFEAVPEDKLGIFNEGRFAYRAVVIYEAMQKYKVELPDWDRISYFNTGVMVVSRDQRHLFNQPEGIVKQKYSYGEQTYLNLRIFQRKIEIKELSHHFNRMSLVDSITGISRLASWFVHYAGYRSEDLLEIIKDDLERWELKKENFETPVLFLNISGGLGDQVCAEPVVRYIREKVYPDARIYAISTYPELFSHIRGITVSDKPPDIKVDAVYRMDFHPDRTKSHHQNMIYNLAHPVDYISLQTLKRILPVKDKQIRLPINPLSDPRVTAAEVKIFKIWPNFGSQKMVLVHPGTGWESKTFPTSWWQAVIDGLSAMGLEVGIIGRNLQKAGITPEVEHSFLPVQIPENGIDFRDKLSTLELAVLIKYAPALISNESAPIHIAGAFNNNIILIPTNKHPEHVLPYRHGSVWYKAAALYKNAAFEDYQFRPSNAEAESIARLKKPIEYYLPDPQEVIETTYNMIARESIYHDPLSVKRKETENEYRTLQPDQ